MSPHPQAYFQPNAERQNLFVLTNAVATKIMFDAITRPLCAVGVQYIHGDQIYCAAVRKEVVLAAGDIYNDSAVLARSDEIGQAPYKLLKSLNSQVRLRVRIARWFESQ